MFASLGSQETLSEANGTISFEELSGDSCTDDRAQTLSYLSEGSLTVSSPTGVAYEQIKGAVCDWTHSTERGLLPYIADQLQGFLAEMRSK